MPKSFCAVSFCTSKSGSGVSLHAFPRDEPRRQKWIEFVRACGRQEYQDWSPVQNSRVCGLHFEAHCFTAKAPDLAYMGLPTRPCASLTSGAVPSILHVRGRLAPVQGDASLPKRPRHETCSARGHEPALPLLVSTDLCAGGDNENTSSGCRVASVHTQCHVQVEVKGTQVSHKAASRSKGIQTRPSVREVECQTDQELLDMLLLETLQKRSSMPIPEPSLVCSEPSLTCEDDPQDKTYEPTLNSSEVTDGIPWQPTKHSKICSHHFVNGEKSNDPRSPAYVPTLFPSVHRATKVPTADRYERLQSREQHEQCTSSCVSPVPDDQEWGAAMAEHTSGAMSVDIKVERSSPPTSPPPWLICVDIKEEPSILPTMASLDMSVDIKAEQSSPPTTPPPQLVCVSIKEEPSSPPTTPPFDSSIDIKVEPSSPTATPPPDPLDMDGEGPLEPQGLVPTVVHPTTSTHSTETSGDTAVMDGDKRLSGGATGSSQQKSKSSVCNKYKSDTPGHRVKSRGCAKKNRIVHTQEKRHACAVCGQHFAQKMGLVQHERAHTGEKPFACTICGRKFARKVCLTRHKAVHMDEKPYPCTVCGHRFAYKSNLQTHQVIHKEEKPYACPICGRQFARQSNLTRHNAVHMNEKPHACTVCDHRFAHKGSLIKHQLLHKEKNPYACLICSQQFTQKSSLTRHMAVHTDNEAHCCSVCGRRFAYKSDLLTHEIIHKEKKPYACLICGRQFARRVSFNLHKAVHADQKPYTCSVCGHGFVYKSSLVKHMFVHKEEKPYSCLVCGRQFAHKTKLTMHKAVHMDEKPYPCSVCGRRFAYKSSLLTHEIIHKEKKPYACLICGRQFTRRVSFNLHNAVHADKKPYPCSVCGRRFAYKSSLLMHEVIHKEEKPYACLVCGSKFIHKANFIRHKSMHMGVVKYACKVCPSKFSTKASLDRHKQLHAAGIQLFHCTECGWAFQETTALEKHLKWHKMDKLYPCHLCPSQFTKRCNLKAHVKMHTGEKAHKCPICQRLYSRHTYLKGHMRRMHPGGKNTSASTDNRMKVSMRRSPWSSLPPEHADANEEGAPEAACGSSNTEASSDAMDLGNTPT